MRKRYRLVALVCSIVTLLNMFLPMNINKVEAVTPDAPNLKTLSQLNQGDSVFFADMEWIVLNPDEGKLIARKSIFELPNFNLNKSSWSIDSYDKALSFLRNDFYNKINLEEKKLITKKLDFPQEVELRKLNSI